MHNSVRFFPALWVAMAFVVVGFSQRVSAAIIEVGDLGNVGVNANSQSSDIIVSIFDSAPGVPATVLGWSLGLRIVPLGGAIGTVIIDTSSFAYPPNHILSPNQDPPGSPGFVTNVPNAGDVTVFAMDSLFIGVTVPDEANARPMMSFRVNASPGASGNFAIWLVNDFTSPPDSTYWVSGETLQDEPFNFNGSPISSSVQVGTIMVSAAAVPEPSSLLLAGTILAIAGWQARRKRHLAAAAPSAHSQV